MTNKIKLYSFTSVLNLSYETNIVNVDYINVFVLIYTKIHRHFNVKILFFNELHSETNSVYR